MARKTTAIKTEARAAATRMMLRDDVRALKRKLIIDAAIHIFYRSGYQSATVDDIAAEISVTKAVVYYHFESKEAVLVAIIERCCDTTYAAVERGIASGNSPAQKLALACFYYAETILDNQNMVGVYFREGRSFPPDLRTRVTASEKAITSKLAEVIENGIRSRNFRPCDAKLLALTILGMISMAFYWHAEHGRLPKAKLCRHFAAEALRMAGFKDERVLEQLLAAKLTDVRQTT